MATLLKREVTVYDLITSRKHYIKVILVSKETISKALVKLQYKETIKLTF